MSGSEIRTPENKAERLALAGSIAPALREKAARTRERRVAIVDKEGNVTGYRALAAVQAELLARARVEIAVDDGVRPGRVLCEECGGLVKIGVTGVVPRRCRQCQHGYCAECEAPLGKSGNDRWKLARRKGKPGVCVPCHRKKIEPPPPLVCAAEGCGRALSRTTSRDATRDGRLAMCKACCRRDEAAKRGREDRTAIAVKANAARTPEGRRKSVEKRLATLTPERRSLASRRAWETRRARQAENEGK